MFQKLYRHLEDIKESLQRDRRDSTNTEAVQVGGKVIEQLEQLNARLHTLQRQSLLSISGVLLVVTLSCGVFFLTRFDHGPRNDRAILPQPSMAGTSQPKDEELAEKRRMLEHLNALDSLIVEQARSIRELKELNATSVATFRRIRRHFYLTEGGAARSHSVVSDSLTASQ